MMLTCSSQQYQSLPPNITRPGGELVEFTLFSFNKQSTEGGPFPNGIYEAFFFVSDNYTASEIKNTTYACDYVWNVTQPIAFNSTGNIHMKDMVQRYRGDSAAIFFRRFDNTDPISSAVQSPAWPCLNSTIGASIPLIATSHPPKRSVIVGGAVGGTLGFICLLAGLIYFFCRRHRRRGSSDYSPVIEKQSSDSKIDFPHLSEVISYLIDLCKHYYL